MNRWPALVLALLGSSSCTLLAPKAQPVRFAVLATVEELGGDEREGDTPARATSVGLGPLVLPDYLRRLAMVSREGTELVPSTTELWGEPLDVGIERVLAGDLRRSLGGPRVILYPWYESDRPETQIELAFTRFERTAADRVVVEATFRLRPLAAEGAVVERTTRIERPAGPDAAEAARALSEALVELCAEIARAWPTDAGPR